MYRASKVPVISNLEDLARFVQSEFEKIQTDSFQIDAVYLTKQFAAPTKPREGMIVLADGTTWNPGAGAGFYGFNAGSWTKF